ncbi:MAG: phosphotransferase [Gammaproteobacteria bacterium]|nr:phosphotransferase [Gammaproteobacteria bacterium]
MSIFAATHSVLSTQALTDFVSSKYAIEKIQHMVFFQAGLNDTYVINTINRKYILRVYRKNWRTLSDIQCEIELLLHLANKNIAVANPVAGNDKQYIYPVNATEGLRHIVLFDYAEGTPPDYDRAAAIDASLYGSTMARMHNALDDFSTIQSRFKIDLEHLIDTPLITIRPFLQDRPDDLAYINQLTKELKARFNELPTQSLSYGFCHGDMNSGNVHIKDKLLTLFDFDCCGESYQAYDLAIFNWGLRMNKFADNNWTCFLEAYQDERNLSPADRNTIPLFTTIRHIWHIGLHTQLSSDRGRNWLDDRYFDEQIAFLKNCMNELK